jgi:opacity protein-like surface antigen
LSICLRAQELNVTGFGGYTLQQKMNFSTATVYVRSNAHYGLSVEAVSSSGVGLELLYQRQQTQAPVYDKSTPEVLLTSKNDLTLSYYMLNPVVYIKTSSSIKPYLAAGIGIASLDMDAANVSGSRTISETQTKFTWDAKIGARFLLSPVVSLKVQAHFYAIANVNGQGIYYTETSNTQLDQFGFTGGICYIFFKPKPKL